ncbi:hypothetical protein ACWGI1_24175 [Streptomyces sp. NPDC054835]|uniref:hypothetical protein n=1 Tax=Streptomyces sp. NBC_01268 TaxID=2903806 RepID=UPI002E360CD3|nr:hypothetical protein [Streptomyces sp. NBC_01268]
MEKSEELALEVRVPGGALSEKPRLVGVLLADERDPRPAIPSEPVEPAGVVGVDADKVWGEGARPFAVTDLGRLDARCAAAVVQPAAEHLLRTRASRPLRGG